MNTHSNDEKLPANTAPGRTTSCSPPFSLPRMPLALLLAAASPLCQAQSAAPGSQVEMQTVVVVGERLSPSEVVRERVEALPGGGAVLDREEFADSARPTVSRALASVPGVVVQEFFGGNDQPRIQIRGSGLQQNPVERGVLVLQDGLPINRADGSYIVGFANPKQAESIEVYRGYLANRLGATVLGGALNFASPTGWQRPGTTASASVGSFGHRSLGLRSGGQWDKVDGLFEVDVNRRDGFRDYNDSERVSVGGNVGFAVSENVSSRLFVRYTDLGFDVAGPLTKSGLKANPRRVHTGPQVTPTGPINPGPNVIRDRPRRDARQFIIGSRTSVTRDAHLIDFGVGYSHTDDTFRFPVSSGVRSTEGGDFTAVVRYAYGPGENTLPLFETTAQYTIGSADRRYAINQAGRSGATFGDSDLDASTLSLFAGLNIEVLPKWTLSPSISYSHAKRENDDRFALATRPTIAFAPPNPTVSLPNGAVPTQSTSYSRSYDEWSPSLALSFRPDPTQTIFAAVSRSFEPPTHDDLIATIGGTPNSSPGRPNPGAPFAAAPAFSTPDLDAQTATTVEAGWRTRTERYAWEAITYWSWVDNELLSLRDVTGASLGAINADKTIHFGIELGGSTRLTDRLAASAAYTYQDFRFDDDPIRGDNRLAGAPPHMLFASLRFDATPQSTIQGAVRWSPRKTPVDNMNTLYVDPYAVVDVRAEYRISPKLAVFGEVTNLFDKTYASSSLVVDQARPDQAAFLPGDGRGFYVGVSASF